MGRTTCTLYSTIFYVLRLYKQGAISVYILKELREAFRAGRTIVYMKLLKALFIGAIDTAMFIYPKVVKKTADLLFPANRIQQRIVPRITFKH